MAHRCPDLSRRWSCSMNLTASRGPRHKPGRTGPPRTGTTIPRKACDFARRSSTSRGRQEAIATGSINDSSPAEPEPGGVSLPARSSAASCLCPTVADSRDAAGARILSTGARPIPRVREGILARVRPTVADSRTSARAEARGSLHLILMCVCFPSRSGRILRAHVDAVGAPASC